MTLRILLLIVFLSTGFFAFSQSSTNYPVSGTYDMPVGDFIAESQSKFKIKVFYKSEWFKDAKIEGTFADKPFVEVLNESLASLKLKTSQYTANVFVIVPALGYKPSVLNKPVNRVSSNETITIGNSNAVVGETATLSGFILDGKTEEPVVGAVVYALNSAKGATSDQDGFYSLEVPIGQQPFRFSYIGYANGVALLDIQSSGSFNMDLYDDVTELTAVTVTAESPDENIQSVTMGVEKLDIKTIKRLPVLLGEADVIKSLMLLPGVTSVGEGASGFNVRGGSVGENLILQDGAEIFNPSHLFGFFSVFNPDLVEDLTLYKGGGIQANMGGRLSSVLDVDLKDGDKEEYHGRGGIGSLMARFAMEGPIEKGKSSFAFGARSSYSDWLLKQYDNINLQKSRAGFYDFNLKVSKEFSDKDNLSLSGYISRDYFQLASDTLFTYGTRMGNVEWNHYFSNSFFSSTRASVGQYFSRLKDDEGNNQFEMKSKINYLTLQQEFVNNSLLMHEFKFGGKLNRYEIFQGDLAPLPGAVNTEVINIPKDLGIELAFYAADTWNINDKLSIDLGVRYSMFNQLGPSDVFVYDENLPMTELSIIDTVSYGSGENIVNYGGFEPRVGLRYSFDEKSSIKAGYNRLRQYMHLVSNTAAVTPVDIWQMSNTHIRPAISDQFTVGYFRNFDDNNIEASVELYYKTTDDILDFKGGAELLLNNALEADLLQGQGRARGLEFSLKKKSGKFNGWISYTYSRTEIQATSPFPLESVNNGEWYPANYDKPHNLSIVYTQRLTKRITFSANFLYSTGRPITAPTNVYRIGPYQQFPNYSERNQYRIPDYHRLDLSLTIDKGFAKYKKVKSEWNFSIYNVYARKNAYSIFFNDTSQAFRLALLSFVPSISYNFVF